MCKQQLNIFFVLIHFYVIYLRSISVFDYQH